MESIKLKNEKYWDAAGVYDHSKQKKQDELNEEFDQAIRNMAVANIKEIEVGDTEPTDPNVKLWIDQSPGQKIEIPTMEDFRNLKPATDEQVSAAVSDWLEENISGGETIAVDKSLTVEGAAADAKVVGDLKSALYYTKQGSTDNFFNSFVNNSGTFSNSTKTIVNGRPLNFTYDHVKAIKCQEGYSFVVYGYDMSFRFLGNLKSNGTFNPSASDVTRYTELNLENYPNVLFRFGLSHFVSGSAVDITPDEANVLTLTYTYNKALANRSLSVIGDSISTFNGYTNPNAPTAYYPSTAAGLRVVDQMYWKALADRNGMSIDVIDAYGGSTVGTKWNDDVNYTPFTDESRLSRLGTPDIIIVEGGINDFGGNPLGDYPTDNAYSNMYEFRTSYAYLLNQLKTRYPYACIVCLSLLTPKTYNNAQFPEKQTEVKQALSSDKTPHYLYEFNDTIKELCARYGCIYCNIYDIVNYYVGTTSSLGPHPFASGHYFIANRLESLLKVSGV